MRIVYAIKNFSASHLKSFPVVVVFFLISGISAFGQPANDNCANASIVTISNSGFGLGVFTSATFDLTSATVQTGENFAPAIFVAGQNQKSIWYKFTLPTTRSVRVTLAQPGSAIAAGDVGFAVYKVDTCLPVIADISTKLTPLGVFGNTFHPCVDAGNYLVQVSGKATANGPVYITVETAATTAVYDSPAQAYDFGVVAEGVKTIYYDVGCQSTEDATEVCTALANYQQYNKSTWHVFTTPAYFDYIAFFLAHQNYILDQTFGYKLYQGDVRTTPFSSLPVADGCDSLLSTYYGAREIYKCGDLSTNTTYSIQIFFNQSFYDNVQVTLATTGVAPAQAPEPILSAIPPSNSLGVLPSSPAGVITTATDNHACNSRHSIHPCNPTLPGGGIIYNDVSYSGYNYNLSTFFRFTLVSASNLSISALQYYNSQPLLIRLFKQDVSNSCNTLDTLNIISQFLYSNNNLTCLEPGNYTIQVSGRDTLLPYYYYGYYYGGLGNTTTPLNLLTDLGQQFTLSINAKTTIPINNYSLNIPGAFDTLNAVGGIMQPLVNGVTYTTIDTFGCANTVLPWDTSCSPTNKKAMYSQFAVADSGIVKLYSSGPPDYLWNKLYRGDANALANAQNAHSFPERIAGLTPYSECLRYNYFCEGAMVCLVPGTYSYVTFTDESYVGLTNQAQVQFNVVNTNHNSPASAEDMGDILNLVPGGGSVQSSIDYYSCKDNAVPINGYQPCNISGRPATKAIYRQFYLNAPAIVSIGNIYGCYNGGYMTLFSGRATDGANTLTALSAPWQCFQSASSGTCTALPAGWYTIVSYGSGPTYAEPFRDLNQYAYSSYVGVVNQVSITVTIACPGPKYNRPYKAAIDTLTNQPFLIEWSPRVGHTAAYPKTDTTYSLYQENFNCTVDTPFTSHPIPNCDVSLTKVAYYVFQTTQESFIEIDTKFFWGAVYAGNAQTDSLTFANANPIQPCLQSYGHIQICRLQPGVYTLVVFATSAQTCENITPLIYIDQVGYSRFDHANNAYDFGSIPPDSVYYNGKPGDVNPLNAGRAPSNDFFYCTTGAQQNDPADATCSEDYVPQIYNPGINNYLYSGNTPQPYYYSIPRRNLWYTFTVSQAGTVRVKVSNKTIGKQYQYRFAVYKSNVDGTLPFTNIVTTGQVDSTIAQGLTLVTQNPWYYCPGTSDEVNFFIEPCRHVVIPERYYILIENPSTYPDYFPGMAPNSQVEVAVLFDSADVNYPGDFCSAPVVASLNGAGTNVTSVGIDCHTIGTDYGEFNPTLTCPAGAMTIDYKTSWFRIDITGTDTLDVTTWLTENTNALPSQIKYRLMNGDCSAMQERSCVQDALTQDTYKCLVPGSYWVQVFTPVKSNVYPYPDITGTIDLHLSAVQHADSCAPANNCLSNAAFAPQFDCNANDIVTFINYSTYGSSISYNWDFGYNGQTSTVVSPQFNYPVLSTDSTYTVSLTVLNTGCGGQSTYSVPVTIPGRPNLELGNDTLLCTTGSSLLLNATTWPGSTYQWQDGSNNSAFNVNSPGAGTYYVTVTYNGCIKSDTINVNINPVTALKQNNVLCGNDSILLESYRGYGETYSWSTGSTNSSIYAGTTGVYVNTINWQGCMIRDTFNVNVAIPPFINDSIMQCDPFQPLTLDVTATGAQSYNWQDGSGSSTFTVTGPGLYWVNVNYGNCSIRDTIRVSVSPAALIDSASASICEGQYYILPWSLVVNTAGIYRDTLHYTTGCDSLRRIVNLTVNATSSSMTNSVVCSNQLPYNWNGVNYSAGGTYTFATVNAAGCDSIATLMLTVSDVTTSTTNITRCSNQLPYVWNGTSYNTSGTYIFNTVNAAGCDSVATLILSVNGVTTSTTSVSRCADQLPYVWNGTNYNTSGTYTFNTTNAAGCDSVATLILIVSDVTASTTNVARCSNQLPYTWNGVDYMVSGTYTFNTVNTAGCDSVATLILTITNTVSSTTNVDRCASQLPYIWNGSSYSAAGTYTFTTTSSAGCDSIATLILTVSDVTTSTTNITRCSNQLPLVWNGANYNTSGIYTFTTVNAAGCDSVATLILTVSEVTVSTTSVTRCSNQLPYNWNGTNYNVAGTYTFNTTNAASCDSIATLILTVSDVTTSTTNVARCSNQLPYTWNGVDYTTSGTYTFNTTNAAGCDSVATLILTISNTVTSTTNVDRCSNQLPYVWNGTSYNSAGNYLFTTTSSTGCDSIATLILTITDVVTSTTTVNRCANQLPYVWNGTNYNAAGAYSFTTISAAGCDSIATLILTVSDVTTSTTNVTRCSNQLPYLWNGTNYNSAGTYTYTTANATGCDSIATLVLTVGDVTTSITNVTRCSNQLPYVWNGTNYNTSGAYTFNTTNAAGCDSVATLILTVSDVTTSTTNVTRCSNQLPYLWNGTNYNTSGTYTFNTTNIAGCDSVATLILSVSDATSSTTNVTRCSNQLPYNWNGTNYNAAGTYVYHTINAVGCDSAATLNLVVNATSSSLTSTTICSGQLPFNWNGTNYNTTGTYVYHTLNAIGCDSAATLNLTVQSPTSQTFNSIICAGQTYTLPWGTVVNSSGVYRDTLHYITGCDSIIRTVNLIVQTVATSISGAIICQGQTYTLPWGTVVNSSGVYRDTLHYSSGCDSIRRIVNLVVQSPTTVATNPVICQGSSYTLPWGVIVNAAGIYRDTLHYTTGCDSIRRTVNLQVRAAAALSTNAAICSDEIYTLPWGMSTNVAGIYTDTVRTTAGCDSLIRAVNLTVDPAPSVSVSKSNDINCMSGTANLRASGGNSYAWTPAASLSNANVYNPVASPSATTWYKVLVTSDKGCSAEDSIEVKVIPGNTADGYLVPNAFTPNADGKNDCFGVQTWGAVTDFEFSIFSRWGERVFYTKDPRQCWDGRYKGAEQSSNVFVYQIKAKGLCGNIYRKGTFVLIR